jgi:hypothetical protein
MRALPVIALMLIVGFALWILRPQGPNRVTAAPAAVGARVPSRAASSPAHDITAERLPMPLDKAASTPSTAAEADANALPRDTFEIPGSVLVTDEDDVDHVEEDGEFDPVFCGNDIESHGHSVAVSKGRFSLHVPVDHDVKIGNLRLGGRLAVVQESRYCVEAGVPLVIRARWATHPMRLRVLDASTRTDLVGVTVIRATSLFTSHCLHPGAASNDSLLVSEAVSPIELGPIRTDDGEVTSLALWVGAPSYAWARVQFDYRFNDERVVELRRGADLEVLVEGEVPPPSVDSGEPATAPITVRKVRIDGAEFELNGEGERVAPRLRLRSRAPRPALGDLVLEMPFDGSTTLHGIAPGSYVVSVERGRSYDDPLVLGSAEIVLEAGGVGIAWIRLVPLSADPEPVPLAGTLRISPKWESAETAFLDFEPIGRHGAVAADERCILVSSMVAPSSPGGIFLWDAGNVLPGRYLVECREFAYETVVDSGPCGSTDVSIEIPDPADAAVRLVDDADGHPLITDAIEDALWWNVRRPSESTHWSPKTAIWDPARQLFSLRAPIGPIELSVHLWEIETVEGETVVVLKPGSNDIALRVRRSNGITLTMRDGPSPMSWEDQSRWDVRVRAIDGSKVRSTTGYSDRFEYRIRVSRPGLYEVTIPALPGFEEIEPFTIDVPAGEFVRHEIQLTRKR